MDYRALLIKYMNHVIDEESVCYLEGLMPDSAGGAYHRPELATDDDVLELISIRDEVLAKRLSRYKAWKALTTKTAELVGIDKLGPCFECKSSRFRVEGKDLICDWCGGLNSNVRLPQS